MKHKHSGDLFVLIQFTENVIWKKKKTAFLSEAFNNCAMLLTWPGTREVFLHWELHIFLDGLFPRKMSHASWYTWIVRPYFSPVASWRQDWSCFSQVELAPHLLSFTPAWSGFLLGYGDRQPLLWTWTPHEETRSTHWKSLHWKRWPG